MKAKIDLHMHSHYSDGELSPEKLVKECKKLGLEIISLTDHETVWGVEEAIKAGKKSGISVIPGIEFSCNFQEQEQHLLGYFIDGFGQLATGYKNPELLEFLKEVGRKRRERFLKMIERLKNLGFFIEYSEVKKYARGSLTRPHLARAIIKNKKNARKLKELRIDTKFESEFFKKYLTEGKGAYQDWERPSASEVIKLLKKSGGIAVWAHPKWKCGGYKETMTKALELRELGLGGMEVFYTRHTQDQTKELFQIAKELGLAVTAGSDFHSSNFSQYNKIFAWQDFGIEEDFLWLKEKSSVS
ncbi:MAG: phosphoesterase [Parcubacteria group bacterium CG11_big_fil_rev_8_21_14_0_20_39_14]|nr:MAG: phosphoesterase [Parcubacteria group bacterium CG11_big_fil_rev_8_21_14_0_20_39_14]PIS35346.1 MAG: phosphoesterase [Parcubacteria group bacterium CG08_land_8_20_14_0_20_38_56]